MAVSLSSEVDPTFREYERLCVTAFDAYLGPLVARYLAGLRETLRRLGVGAVPQIMRSRGGIVSAAVAAQHPVTLVPLGPGRRRDRGPVRGRALGRARLHLARHGRDQQRRERGPRGAARRRGRGAHRTLSGADADGGRQHDRRGRREHRVAGRGGRPPGGTRGARGRSRVRPATAGAATGRPSPTRASSSAISTPRTSRAGRFGSTPGPPRPRSPRSPGASGSTSSRPPPASTAS